MERSSYAPLGASAGTCRTKVFPDGVALDDKTDPWLLTGLVRTYMPRIPARPLGYVENPVSVFLAWLLVPITLFFYWRGLLPAHDIGRLAVIAFLIAFTTWFGWRTFHLARAMPRRQVPPGDRARMLLIGLWRDFRVGRGQIAVFCLLAGTIMVSSMFACWQSPRDADTKSIVVFSPYALWQSLREVDPTPTKLMNFLGVRTYADLREVDVAVRPEGWTGKEWDKVKRVDLRGRDLAFADATRAFLVNADLRGANLTGAVLTGAQLQGAVLYDTDRYRGAQLQGADLQGARLEGADLSQAQLQGADLTEAQLQGATLPNAKLEGAKLQRAQLQGANLQQAQLEEAILRGAHLQGAILLGAELQGASLTEAQLQGANLGEAQLQGADLTRAQLQGARLWRAQLQGADISMAKLQGADLRDGQLRGADLRETVIWRANVRDAQWDNDTQWDLADLRASTVQPMTESEIDSLIGEATKGILERTEATKGIRARTKIVEALTAALRTESRSPRPDLPEEWRSEPNVMFDPGDPAPEPFDWGPSKWATEQAYDEELAAFLGDLACGSDVPEVQTRGLARRALYYGNKDRPFAHRLAARMIGPDCAPGKALLEDMRRELQQLAAPR